MSYRIQRMMGYGMPWEKFEALATLPVNDQGKTESLYSIFAAATDEQLTVPREFASATFNMRGVSPILDCRLLSEEFTDFGRKEPKIVSGTKLMCLVSNANRTTDVVFFPNACFAKKWCRRNDDLDYAFEQWSREVDGHSLGDRKAQSGPRDFTIYTGYGFYPFNNFLMHEDGSPKEWEYYFEVEKHPEWLPAVPSEIRWYLKELKILDDAGINQLRPCISQVWS